MASGFKENCNFPECLAHVLKESGSLSRILEFGAGKDITAHLRKWHSFNFKAC